MMSGGKKTDFEDDKRIHVHTTNDEGEGQQQLV